MTCKAGEDVVEQLCQFATRHRRNVVLLAACGVLSSATLTQVGASSAEHIPVALDDHFTVLSLSGALMVGGADGSSGDDAAARGSDAGVKPELTGGLSGWLSASLADPSGHVYSGAVGGPLVVAGGVTLVLGHYDTERTSPGAAEQLGGVPGLAALLSRQQQQ